MSHSAVRHTTRIKLIQLESSNNKMIVFFFFFSLIGLRSENEMNPIKFSYTHARFYLPQVHTHTKGRKSQVYTHDQ